MNRYHHEQHQNQQQAQVLLGPFASKGRIEWKRELPENSLEFLNQLAPEQALFAKIREESVYYPVFTDTEPAYRSDLQGDESD